MKALFLAAAAALFISSAASAHDFQIGSLTVEHPWARSTPPVAKTGAVYLSVRNNGSEEDSLIGIATATAESAEIHVTKEEGRLTVMRHVGTVPILPGGSVRLDPGGMHVMLVGLKAPLAPDKSFPIVLTFAKAGAVEIWVEVSGREPTPAHTGH